MTFSVSIVMRSPSSSRFVFAVKSRIAIVTEPPASAILKDSSAGRSPYWSPSTFFVARVKLFPSSQVKMPFVITAFDFEKKSQPFGAEEKSLTYSVHVSVKYCSVPALVFMLVSFCAETPITADAAKRNARHSRRNFTGALCFVILFTPVQIFV